MGLDRLEPPRRELPRDLVERQSPDAVPSLLLGLRHSESHRCSCDGSCSGLAYRDAAPGDTRHLRQAERGALEMVKAIVDVDNVDRSIPKRKGIGVGDDERELEAEAPRSLAGLEDDAERDV